MNISAEKLRVLGIVLGGAVVIALAVYIFVFFYVMRMPGMPEQGSSVASGALKDAFVLQVEGQNMQVYREISGTFVPVNVGSALRTSNISRKGSNLASIQQGSLGVFEVRVDATLFHSAKELITSAGASPDGKKVAFAATDPAKVQAADKAHPGVFPSFVFLVPSPGATPLKLGAGFAPFFVSDQEVAWFSDAGLMLYRIDSKKTITLAKDARAIGPLYPAPAVAAEGGLVAWTTPEDQTIHVWSVTSSEAKQLITIPHAKSSSVAVDATGVYALVADKAGTSIWKYALVQGADPAQLAPISAPGRTIQLVP